MGSARSLGRYLTRFEFTLAGAIILVACAAAFAIGGLPPRRMARTLVAMLPYAGALVVLVVPVASMLRIHGGRRFAVRGLLVGLLGLLAVAWLWMLSTDPLSPCLSGVAPLVAPTAIECFKSQGYIPDAGLLAPLVTLALVVPILIIVPMPAGHPLRLVLGGMIGGMIGGGAYIALREHRLGGLDSQGHWISMHWPLDPYALATAVILGAFLGVLVLRLWASTHAGGRTRGWHMHVSGTLVLVALMLIGVQLIDAVMPASTSLPIGMLPVTVGVVLLPVGLAWGLIAGSGRYKAAGVLAILGTACILGGLSGASIVPLGYTRPAVTVNDILLVLGALVWLAALLLGWTALVATHRTPV